MILKSGYFLSHWSGWFWKKWMHCKMFCICERND